MNEEKQYTIKDIARMAGVSAGTVDRVLHHRGEVSASSKQKVEAILKEIDYKPNVYAIGLARKKKYNFACLIPQFQPNDYWFFVAEGIKKALEEMASFNITVSYIHYDHSDRLSYIAAGERLLEQTFDAVLIAPNYSAETLNITSHLCEKGIPFVFVDVNVEEAGTLGYIGQDSFRSGYITARILNDTRYSGQEIVLLSTENDLDSQEIQMQHRLEGFKAYMQEHQIDIKMHNVVLRRDHKDDYLILDDFFRKHPLVRGGVVFNSQIYRVGEFLKESSYSLDSLIGYDLLPRNVELLKEGIIHFLVGQRPGMQGYGGIKMLADKVVFKRELVSLCYMPIDIIIKENLDYYVESYNL